MNKPLRSIQRENRTLRAMVGIYCRGTHGHKGALCSECTELTDYAAQRVARCPWGDAKPACAQCTIHCYKPAMRQRVIAVMRYAGPRMAVRHPVFALLHLLRRSLRPGGRPVRR